jgi:hypothetical protein
LTEETPSTIYDRRIVSWVKQQWKQLNIWRCGNGEFLVDKQ